MTFSKTTISVLAIAGGMCLMCGAVGTPVIGGHAIIAGKPDSVCFDDHAGRSYTPDGSPALTTAQWPGDFNGDGDVDLDDFEDFEACLTGPSELISPECEVGDFDMDGDVDILDATMFFEVFSRGAMHSRQPRSRSGVNIDVLANGSDSITVLPGAQVDYEVVAELSDTANEGLAFVGFDLVFDGGDLPQADTPTSPPMNNFVKPEGITNPAGFGGTTDVPGWEGALVQVGGGQNTIKNTPDNADFPIGTVITGVGQPGAPVVVASGTFTAPVTPDTYTLAATNVFASVIKDDETGTPFWAIESAAVGTVTSVTITVSEFEDCNDNGVPDDEDIANCPPGELWCADCNENTVPDECEPDSDGDGIPDECESTGPDAIIADLQSVRRFGRVGDITAYSSGINVCNVGDERVSWIAHTNAHPGCVQGMYRLKDDRFEQIGMGWMWHGFYAVSQSFCGPCYDPTDGSSLGVGCSNPDSASLLGVQNNMSLRSDVNAHTGYFPYPPTWGEWEELIDKRIQVHDADLDPDLNDGALYFVESHFIAADEAAAENSNNNTSHRPVVVNESEPNVFTVLPTGITQREQPAIRAWQDADSSVVETDVQVPGEGLFIAAVKSRDLGDGFWRYEYAVQNVNSDRSCQSFSVPLPEGSVITNVGFHDVDYHSGEIYDLTDWAVTVEDDAITWATESYDVNPNANALRFDTLYNFYFDANVEPAPIVITLGLFKPGFPADVAINTIGPSLDMIDCNGNGIADACDIDCGAPDCSPPCGGSADCNDNGVPDECEPDCNENGVADECDIANCPPGELWCADCNENTVPDGCEPDCDGDGIPDDCDTWDDTDDDGIYDCYDLCSCTPIPCVCPEYDRCCWPSGICIDNFPRDVCIEQGGTPDCVEPLCEDGCLIALPDCNNNGIADVRDITCGPGEDCAPPCGGSQDDNGNGIPDECECVPVDAPMPENPVVAKNRYLSLQAANPGCMTALRVTLVSMPADPPHYDFTYANGWTMWAGPPHEYCENSAQTVPPLEGCGPAPGLDSLTMWAAQLQCEPHYTDWGLLGAVHLYDKAIVPSGTYVIQALGDACDDTVEDNYSTPLTVVTSQWGDIVGDFIRGEWSPPDSNIGVLDYAAIVDKFKNLPAAPRKARADIAGEPPAGVPDQLANFLDISYAIEAFRGLPYPFDGPSGCP
ncbi:MAG: hypothetical protein WBE26_00635 [Phycisphaerae bacterium]